MSDACFRKQTKRVCVCNLAMFFLQKLQNSPTEMGKNLRQKSPLQDMYLTPQLSSVAVQAQGFSPLLISSQHLQSPFVQVFPPGTHGIHIPQALGGLRSRGFAGVAVLYDCGSCITRK